MENEEQMDNDERMENEENNGDGSEALNQEIDGGEPETRKRKRKPAPKVKKIGQRNIPSHLLRMLNNIQQSGISVVRNINCVMCACEVILHEKIISI